MREVILSIVVCLAAFGLCSGQSADWQNEMWREPQVRYLLADMPYGEANVRYFMADIALGGSIEFYRRAAERDHEMACLEAVRRSEEGFAITNIGEFERKQVAGKTTITRRGENRRIHGREVILASDRP